MSHLMKIHLVENPRLCSKQMGILLVPRVMYEQAHLDLFCSSQ